MSFTGEQLHRTLTYLEEVAGVLIAQVHVDHAQQPLHLLIAHLVVMVLVSLAQESMNPSRRSRKAEIVTVYSSGRNMGPLKQGSPTYLKWRATSWELSHTKGHSLK